MCVEVVVLLLLLLLMLMLLPVYLFSKHDVRGHSGSPCDHSGHLDWNSNLVVQQKKKKKKKKKKEIR